jgi:hypothetical protein
MRFVLQPVRIPVAIGAGSVVGAGVVAVVFSLPALVSPLQEAAFGLLALTFIVALMVWSAGVVVIGGPAWVILHERGRVSPANALSLGLAATFIVAFLFNLLLQGGMTELVQDDHVLITKGWRTVYGWLVILKDCILLSLLGGVVATVIWRVAYRTEG